MDPGGMSRRAADLLAVLQIARQLGATTDIHVLLDLVVTGSASILGAERCSLFLYDPVAHELVTRVAMGARTLRVPADRGVVGAAAMARQVVVVHDAYQDPRFNPEVDRQTGFRTRNILAVPLPDQDDRLVGVLQVLNKQSGGFDEEDEFIASVLAAQAGVALQRARLMDEYWVKKRMERDLDIARTIQRGYLPRENPAVEGFDVAGWNRPADETGGDCYDFHPVEGGRLAVFLADATGHGIGPALLVSECRALVRVLSDLYPDDAGKVLSRVDALLEGDLPSGHFVTAFLGVLDPAQGRMAYHSAGQAPWLVYRATEDQIEWHGADGPPLGILGSTIACEPVPRGVVEFAPGDVFVALTDGFMEWTDPSGEQYGTARLASVVKAGRSLTAAGLIDAVRADVERFARATRQADDLTAVVIRRLPGDGQ